MSAQDPGNSAEKQGVLLKRGRAQGFSFVRPWDRRSVSLHLATGELSYFEEKGGRLELRGQASVLGGSARPVSEDAAGGKPWAFEITFPSSSTNAAINSPGLQKGSDKDLMFAAKSSAEREEWISAISHAAAAKNKPNQSSVSKPVVNTPPQIHATPPRPHPAPSAPIESSLAAVAPASAAGQQLVSAPPDKNWGEKLEAAVKLSVAGPDSSLSGFRRRLELLRATHGFKQSLEAIPNYAGLISALFPGRDVSGALAAFTAAQPNDACLALRYVEKKLDIFDLGLKGFDFYALSKTKLVAEISCSGFPNFAAIELDVPAEVSNAALASALSSRTSIPAPVLEQGITTSMGPEFSVASVVARNLYQDIFACEQYIAALEGRLSASEERLATKLGGATPHSGRAAEDAAEAVVSPSPFIPSLLGHCEQEFKKADEDCDGFLSRQEWRKWLFEKEKLIKQYNAEKAELLKENRNIKKAMSPMQKQALEAIEVAEARREAAERELAFKMEENRKLLAELSALMFPSSPAAESTPTSISQPLPAVAAPAPSGRASSKPQPQSPLQPSSRKHHSGSVDFGDDDLGDMVNGGARDPASENSVESMNLLPPQGLDLSGPAESNTSSWVRPLLSESKPNPPSGSMELLYSAPMSIAEHLILKRRSEGGIPEEVISELRAPPEKLGRETTMQVFSGIHDSKYSKHSPYHGHEQSSGRARVGSPGRDEAGLSARRSPSSPSRLSPSRGAALLSQHRSPTLTGAHDGIRRGRSRPDYMAPTVVSQIKEKPQVLTPAGALRASSPWF